MGDCNIIFTTEYLNFTVHQKQPEYTHINQHFTSALMSHILKWTKVFVKAARVIGFDAEKSFDINFLYFLSESI